MTIPRWAIGEFLGTFLLVFFGCGSVCASVLMGAQVGLFQVAIVWGIGIAVAIHLTSSLSGAHLNPAVTLAFSIFGDFEKRKVPGYFLCQLVGAFCAAAVLHVIFGGAIEGFEKANNISRGAPGSEASAMIYGEYFPNPGGRALDDVAKESLSSLRAFFIEAVGTAILVLVIFGLTDRRNQGRADHLNPLLIGLTVTILISLLAPLTQGCFNPARDFGPRIFSSLAGWEKIPFTTNGHGWWFVYIAAPMCGGLAGAAIYRAFLKNAYQESGTKQST